jgi:hypothetical protein
MPPHSSIAQDTISDLTAFISCLFLCPDFSFSLSLSLLLARAHTHKNSLSLSLSIYIYIYIYIYMHVFMTMLIFICSFFTVFFKLVCEYYVVMSEFSNSTLLYKQPVILICRHNPWKAGSKEQSAGGWLCHWTGHSASWFRIYCEHITRLVWFMWSCSVMCRDPDQPCQCWKEQASQTQGGYWTRGDYTWNSEIICWVCSCCNGSTGWGIQCLWVHFYGF